jgi:hypothetical protein
VQHPGNTCTSSPHTTNSTLYSLVSNSNSCSTALHCHAHSRPIAPPTNLLPAHAGTPPARSWPSCPCYATHKSHWWPVASLPLFKELMPVEATAPTAYVLRLVASHMVHHRHCRHTPPHCTSRHSLALHDDRHVLQHDSGAHPTVSARSLSLFRWCSLRAAGLQWVSAGHMCFVDKNACKCAPCTVKDNSLFSQAVASKRAILKDRC